MEKILFSKRKLFKIFSSTKLILWIFFLGSSVFANWDVFSQPIEIEKKDLSVFVSRLSERLQGVVWEIIELSTQKKISFTDWTQSQNDVVNRTLIDVQDHVYEKDILSLVDLWVVDSYREKFYPDNYLRRYELVIMLVKYRFAQQKKQIPPVVFPLRWWFFDVAQNISYAPYVAYAEQQGWISQLITQKDDKKFYFPNKFLSKMEICTLLQLDVSHQFCTQDYIKRGEFVHLLLRWFSNIDNSLENTSDTDQENSSHVIDQAKKLFSFVITK